MFSLHLLRTQGEFELFLFAEFSDCLLLGDGVGVRAGGPFPRGA